MELREKIAEEIWNSGCWAGDAEKRLRATADRILAIPEIASALNGAPLRHGLVQMASDTIWLSDKAPFDDPWVFDRESGEWTRLKDARSDRPSLDSPPSQ